ncbi:MAG: endospore germination permease [Thermoanaerobacterales bacterium]|nr:endospore germination permease [Thermoanaerobacterales bacterium]
MGIEKGKISRWQAILLVSNSILASMVLITPALLTKEAGQDAWLSVLIAGILGYLIGLFVVSLGLRFPEKNLVEYSIDLLGPWFGRAVCIIFALFFLHINAYLVRAFSVLLMTETMPETPLSVLNIFLVILVAYGVYLGLEVFSRVNEIIFPLFMLAGLIIFALAAPEMDFEQLKPYFTHSFSGILWGSLILASFYAEGSFLLMLIPSLRNPKDARKIVLPVSIILLFVIFTDVVGLISLFGAQETARMLFPTFELAKTVHLGAFVERIESLVVGLWVSSVSLKIMAFYYVSVLIIAEVFNLKDYRPLVLPYAFVLLVLSLIGWEDTNHVRFYLSRYFPLFAVTVMTGTTLLLYIASSFRRKDKKGGETQ